MKFCRACGVEKPLSDFYKHKRAPDGYQSYCKECHTARNVAWARNNPEKAADTYKRYSLKKKYGLSQTEYQTLIDEQGSCCAICGDAFKPVSKNAINVDHNHQTGAVRGLLCNNCNPLLGNAKDSVTILNKAIAYLQARGAYG